MDTTFKVEVQGLGKDLSVQIRSLRKRASGALQIVGAEMRDNLVTHLHTDWYTKYKPSVYARRTDNPDLGTAITDKSVMTPTVKGTHLQFDYMPVGETRQAISFETRDGNDLIEWIQQDHIYEHQIKRKRGRPKKNAPTTEEVSIPARPFWNNFVIDQQKKSVDAFIDAMTETANGDYAIERDATDIMDFSEYLLADGGLERLKTGGTSINKEHYTEEFDDEDDENNLPY